MSESPVEKTKKKPDLIKFGNERCSDLILFVEDQDFIVHRMVLAAHSDVFDVMLFGGFKEAKKDRVEIKDVSVDIFKKILEIFYYGRMSENEALHFVFDHEIGPVYKSPFHYYGATITYAEKYCRKLWNFVNELLAVADRFNIVELVLKSLQEEIAKNICTRNHCFYCLNFYMFAFEKNMPILDAFPCFTKDNYKARHTAIFKEDLHIGQQPGIDADFSREVSLMPFLPMLPSTPIFTAMSEDGPTTIVSLAPGPTTGVQYPLNVVYCGECAMPLEYCEYSGITEKCRKWAEENAPDIMAGLSVQEAPSEAEEKKHQKRGGKGPKIVEKKKASSGKVTLQREPRGKKSVTVIKGLGGNEIDLKVAAKAFAQKFACGSSVTGADEIVIQGDVKDDVFDLILSKWPQITEEMIEDLGDKKR